MVKPKPGPAPLVVVGIVMLVAALVYGWGLYGDQVADVVNTDSVIESAQANPQSGKSVAAAASSKSSLPARIVRGEDVVDFLFAHDSATLPAGAQVALADIVKGVAIGKSAVISVHDGAADTPGEQAVLAGQRTAVVREALMDLGIGADKLIMRQSADDGDAGRGDAGRVEVSLSA